MNALEEAITRYLEKNPVAPYQKEKVAKLAAFTEYVLSENEKYNLTAIKDTEKAALLHIVDSLSVQGFIKAGTLCDVGAGAGFPSLPLAIYRDDLRVTALDATAKKVTFMNSAAAQLELNNFEAINGRAEDLFAAGTPLWESFDTVIARAVAPLNVLCELCIPAVKVGGTFIAMRGESAKQEMEEYAKKNTDMVRKLGVWVEKFFYITLHGNEEDYTRYFCIFHKMHETDPKLPRSFANIKKRPLF